MSKYIIYIIIFSLYCCKRDGSNTQKNEISQDKILKKSSGVDTNRRKWVSNFGIHDSLFIISPKTNNIFIFEIVIHYNKRLFYKILYLNEDIITEKALDVMYFRNDCKIPYKHKKIFFYDNKKDAAYYNNVKTLQYKDTVITNFLLSKIDAYAKPIGLMDPSGTFKIYEIDQDNNVVDYFDLFGYLLLYKDKQIKAFYSALLKRTKKDDCECL